MTNREIAKSLGVSPATLSLIINNKPGVSEAKRNEILSALKQMGYGSLIKKEDVHADQDIPQNICFAVYKKNGSILDSSPFFMLILESIEKHAERFQYNVQYSFLNDAKPLEQQLERLESSSARGIIVFATEMPDKNVAAFSKLSVPCVFLDNSFPSLEADCITINNRLGTAQAISYLVRKGHTKIGYLRSESRINSFCERETGYQKALQELGLTLEDRYIYTLPFSETACYRKMKELIAAGTELPTAFVSDDDILSSGVLTALTEAGYRVSDDFSIVGFNDRPMCELTTPPMTTIRVPRSSLGAAAVDLLHNRIAAGSSHFDESGSFKLQIGTKLVIRGT